MNGERICLVYNTGRYLYRFRKELIEEIVAAGGYVYAIFPFDEFTEKIESLGVVCFDLDIDAHGIQLFRQINIYRNLKSILSKIKPHKVLSFTIKPVVFTSILAKKTRYQYYPMITGIGRIYIRNDRKTRFIRALVNLLYRRYFKYNKLAFFQNTADRDLFVESGFISRNKTVMINGSGVNLAHFQEKKWDSHISRTSFLMAGRLDDTKGLYEYLQAVTIVGEKYSSDVCEFLLVGGVHESSVASEILDAISKCSRIEYPGLQNEMRIHYSRATVFVLPSYREGTSRAILEAMACGLPIITTDVPGCKEPVSHMENGLIVPVKNVEKLVSAMCYFIENPEQAAIMGAKSREIAENQYDVQDVVAVILRSIHASDSLAAKSAT